MKASKIDREEPECQAAILLACIGSDAYEIFTTLEFSEESDKQDPTKLLEAFDKYCIGEINEVYERYVFHRRHQEPGEQFDVFLSDLRRLVKSCAYGTVEDSTIRDRIVLGIRDDATRKKLLQTRTLNLAKAIDICRSAEVAHRQLKDITTPDEVQVLRQQPRAHWQRSPSRPRYDQSHTRPTRPQRSPSPDRRLTTERRCHYCNRKHEPSKHECPAYGHACKQCGKANHWAVVCRSKPTNDVRQLHADATLMALDNFTSKRIFSHLYVDGRKVKFLLDCGATVNLLPRSVTTSMGRTDLRPPRSTLRMFDGNELRTVGILTASLQHPRTKVSLDVDFYVTDREIPVLGIEACRRLDLIRIVEDNICEVIEADKPYSSPTPSPTLQGRLSEADVFAQYGDLFDGTLGLLAGDVHLETDVTINPVQMPLRRLPVAIRDQVETELNKMVTDGIIAPVTEPTRWVSALLVVSKPNGHGLRICQIGRAHV